MRALRESEKGEENGHVPSVPPPLHHDLDYVIETWLQHRTHHTYPEPGGYNDQDALLMEDWKTLNLWYIRVSRGVVNYNPELMNQTFPDIKQWVHD